MTAYSLELAPPEDVPEIVIEDHVTFDWTPTIPSDGYYREKRVDAPEQGPSTASQSSSAALDLRASSWFYYGPIPYAEGHPATPSEFVWTLYKPGSDGSFQATRWVFGLRFITDSQQVQLRLRAHNLEPKLGLISVNGRRIQERSISTTMDTGAYLVTLTFPDAREREIDIAGLNELFGSFGGVAINSGRSLRRPDMDDINEKRVALIGDSFVDGAEGVSDVETFAWRLAVHLGATDIMSAGIGGTGWVVEANGDPNTRYRARIPHVMGLDPDIVMMAGGANEAGSTQEELVTQIKSDLQLIGDGPTVLLVDTAGEGSVPRAALKQVAAETTAIYLDGPIDSIPTIDGVHPTYEGHQTLGDALYQSYLALPQESISDPTRVGPCNWPVSFDDCPSGMCESLSSLPASAQDRLQDMATTYLWNWSGKRYGLCDVTVRPCRQDCNEGVSTFFGSGPFAGLDGLHAGPWRPVIINGMWYNLGCGRCGDNCSCGYTPSVQLPGPIASVTSVRIDGQLLPSSSYRVDNGKYLVRLDGQDWPTCQDMAAPTTAENTWEVTYTKGVPVPVGGQVAAGVLACEFAKALCNSTDCQLPKRVQSITRQGVTVAILDSFDDIDTGHTGIWLIDSWLASVTKPPRRSRVFSPDRPREPVRRTTWRA